jgi:hypothetical protein
MSEEKPKVEKKADVTLSDGVEITFDKRKIKVYEWKSLHDPEQPEEEGEAILARFAGVEVEYLHELSVYDRQLLYLTARDVVQRPPDPNLASGSILP